MRQINKRYFKAVVILSNLIGLITLPQKPVIAQWSPLGNYPNSGVFNDAIKCLTKDKSGNLYAAGTFYNDSGKYYVAKWNGSSWNELGGINGGKFNWDINCLTTDTMGNVYAAGEFYNDSGKNYVAKWNGINWVELGGANSSKFNGWINTVTTDLNGNVYAAGQFYNDSSKSYIAKWDGSKWVEMGGRNKSNFIGTINSIKIDKSGNIYAAIASEINKCQRNCNIHDHCNLVFLSKYFVKLYQ